MNKLKSILAFTLIELLVVISIIAILASFAVPAVIGGLTQGQLTQAINNCKQIHLATFNMANDAVTTGDPSLGWPGDLATGTANVIATEKDFAQALVSGDYLRRGDLRVFAATGIQAYNSTSTTGTDVSDFNQSVDNCAYKIFKVTANDDSAAIFLETKNFTYGTGLSGTTSPFGDKGFVVFHKGGDGGKYKNTQATPAKRTLLGTLPNVSGTSIPQSEQGAGTDYLKEN